MKYRELSDVFLDRGSMFLQIFGTNLSDFMSFTSQKIIILRGHKNILNMPNK